MSFMKKSAAALVLTGVAAATSTALAAGFQLTEQSSLGAGRAYAGAGIVGDDLSAVHYNPAGMTLLEGTRFQAGGVWIALNADYNGKDGSSENGRLKGQMIPAGYVTHQVNDKIWLGFAMTVPFGMGTEYDRNWSESQRGTNAKIYTFDMNPNIAWKVNDFLSVGAGISVQYAKAELGMGLKEGDMYLGHGKVEADSWDWGFNLGIMISPTDKLRFGLAYRSAIEHDADGTTKLSGMNGTLGGIQMPALGQALSSLEGQTFGMSTSIKTPDTVMLTGTWEATEKLRLSGLIRWANWSNFKELNIENDVPGSILGAFDGLISSNPALGQLGLSSEMLTNVDVVNEWKDTWLFSVGADYKINNAFTVRGGIAYETSPVDDQSTRMAVIPDTDRVWLSLGASWYATKDLQFDIGATYLMGVGDKDLYDDVNGTKAGEFDSLDAYLLGIQMQYRF
ncbi:outer membrane protein transport protein [Parasutterella secunda]|uniref:OmpP1/FadL family transporter n=1 Tax=Parasutterella secunda TaxID=626947 RepID=UPI00201277DA|nr:outer membrane protein transport protein [Parasutterella secunda]MCL1596154.1 outer membrane protein transport protein [Parasutterella secunda]